MLLRNNLQQEKETVIDRLDAQEGRYCRLSQVPILAVQLRKQWANRQRALGDQSQSHLIAVYDEALRELPYPEI